MPFQQLGITPSLCAVLQRIGYQTPTPVQQQAIPVVLRGDDLIARAQTGTGKTAAFGLPIIERLLATPRRTTQRIPRALVLVPTRELALQVQRTLSSYGGTLSINAAAIYGGVSMGAQIRELKYGVDIVVATPGRLIDHLDRRTIDLSGVEVLTLDEADRMLDMGFKPALRRIMPAVPAARQTLLFSATLPAEVLQLANAYTRRAVSVDVSDGSVVASTITHHMHAVSVDQKRAVLTHVLGQSADQALVFCKTKRGSDKVGQHLERSGIQTAVIHGNKSQNARVRALATFKSGQVQVLVATDIAARGLDIAQLPLVVNFDLPLVAEDYIHRIGRTGRAGCEGRAVSLVSRDEAELLRDIQRLLPVPIANVPLQGFVAPPVTTDARTATPAETRLRHRHARPSSHQARRTHSHAPAERSTFAGRTARPHARPKSRRGVRVVTGQR